MKKNTNPKEHGNALIMVMIAMVLIMGISGALVDHFLTSEADAISEHLAKIRIHWAIRSQLDMSLSSAKNDSNLNGNNSIQDSTKGANISNIIRNASVSSPNISNATIMQSRGSDSNGYPVNRWYYPDRVPSNNYIFDIATKVLDNTVGNCGVIFSPATSTTDGRLCMQFEVRDPATNTTDAVTPVPILQRLVKRRIAMRADICVGNSLVTGRTTVGSACTVNGGGPGEDTFGDRYISTIERFGIVLPPPS